MAGLVHLGRMIDKARAYRKNKMGDYIYPCSFDKVILNFMSIDSETFANKVVDCEDDEIDAWSQEILKSKKTEELDFINHQILERKLRSNSAPIDHASFSIDFIQSLTRLSLN